MAWFDEEDFGELGLAGIDEGSISDIAQAAPVIPVFLLADTSRSMILDGNINKLNSAIQELRPLLSRVQGADAQVRIAIYTFGKVCAWQTTDASGEPAAVPVDEFVWNDVRPAGDTPLGKALRALNEKLSRDGFIPRGAMYYKPVILLITDDEPTDDWEPAMDELLKNGWFRAGIRVAIGPGGSRESVLSRFTGSPDSVVDFPGEDADQDAKDKLSRLIQGIVVCTTNIATHTRSGGKPQSSERLAVAAVKSVRQALEDEAADFEDLLSLDDGGDMGSGGDGFDEDDF